VVLVVEKAYTNHTLLVFHHLQRRVTVQRVVKGYLGVK